jgi:hypothetical protein
MPGFSGSTTFSEAMLLSSGPTSGWPRRSLFRLSNGVLSDPTRSLFRTAAPTRRVSGRCHDYITGATAIDGSCVLHVGLQRTLAAAEAVLQTLPVEQRKELQSVAADMPPADANAIANRTQTPN